MGRDGGIHKAIATTATAIAVVAATVAPALAAGVPEEFAPVASGSAAGHAWWLGMAGGENGMRCYELAVSGAPNRQISLGSASGTCEPVGLQGEVWRRALGSGSEGVSAELEITSKRVARLELLLGHPGPLPGETGPPRHPSTWRAVETRMLTVRQGAEAHLRRDFRFAVIAEKGGFCVERVRALDRHGRLLLSEPVPCEH